MAKTELPIDECKSAFSCTFFSDQKWQNYQKSSKNRTEDTKKGNEDERSEVKTTEIQQRKRPRFPN